MARLASIAVAGFFAIPSHLIAPVAGLLQFHPGKHRLLDPCAGEGEALFGLARAWDNSKIFDSDSLPVCGIEMEGTRFRTLRNNAKKINPDWRIDSQFGHGDCFCVIETGYEGRFSVLYLNPPYAHDPIEDRLEEKFLNRYRHSLVDGGALLFVVPHYALEASAKTLATHFRDLECYAFPPEDFKVYKQVVLVAYKRNPLPYPDPSIVAQVKAWSQSIQGCPVLGVDYPTVNQKVSGITGWREPSFHFRDVDPISLGMEYQPWKVTDRRGKLQTLPGAPTLDSVKDVLSRSYPMGMPPRVAHISMAIASGIFNGSMVQPDDPSSLLPPLLVKGVYDKEWVKDGEEKTNKKGDTSQKEIQQSKLVVTVFDLKGHKFQTLPPSRTILSELPNGEGPSVTRVEDLTMDSLLSFYGKNLLRVMMKQCPVLHDPANDTDRFPLPSFKRSLYRAQEEVVRANVKLLGGPQNGLKLRNRYAFLLGELGSGKTFSALATAETLGAKNLLVVCPPHLIAEWQSEVGLNLLNGSVTVLDSVTSVDSWAAREGIDDPNTLSVGVLSRETGKLGHGWESVGKKCPKCGAPTPVGVDHAKKRSVCDVTHKEPMEELGRALYHTLPSFLGLSPSNMTFLDILGKHVRVGKTTRQTLNQSDKDNLKHLASIMVNRVITHYQKGSENGTHYLKHIRNFLLAVGEDRAYAEVCVAFYDLVGEKVSSSEYAGGAADLIKAFALEILFAIRDNDLRGFILGYLSETYPKKYTTYYKTFGWPELIQVHNVLCGNNTVSSSTTSADSEEDEESLSGIPSGGEKYLVYLTPSKSGALNGIPYGSRMAAIVALETLCTGVQWKVSEPCGERLFQATPDPRRFPLAKYILNRHSDCFDMLVVDECFPKGTPVDIPGGSKPIEQVKVGDQVYSYNEITDSLCLKNVVRVFRKTPSTMVLVHTRNGGTLASTANHPYFTVNRGWVDASSLKSTDSLVFKTSHGSKESVGGVLQSLRRCLFFGGEHSPASKSPGLRFLQHEVCEGSCGSNSLRETESIRKTKTEVGGVLPRMWGAHGLGGSKENSSCKNGVCFLLQEMPLYLCRAEKLYSHEGQEPGVVRQDAREQSHQEPGSSKEDERGYEGSNLHIPWRKWDSYCPSNETCKRFGLGDGGYRPNPTCEGSLQVSSESLQGGSWGTYAQNSCGSGRKLTQNKEVEVFGPAQGGGFEILGVDRVEVLEQGSDRGFGSVCPDGFVYNFEVEDTHTYFVNGILVHNCQEYTSTGSAQEKAVHRLTEIGKPVLLQTGSSMNGYASSLFANLWACNRDFRNEYDKDEEQAFVDRYGFRTRVVETKEKERKNQDFGTVTDRVTGERLTGNAPGVVPTLVLKWILPWATTLHKSDLGIKIPELKHEKVFIQPTQAMDDEIKRLAKTLIERMRKDQFDEEKAGKLFGAMAHLPSYLDLCTLDAGNQDDGKYELRYPESLNSELVDTGTSYSPATILPKEEWMLKKVREELDAGNNVMVWAWHRPLLARYKRLLEGRLMEKVALLDPAKVGTKKRRDWINKEVVDKNVKVMVVNPQAIQTGLNNLVRFSTVLVMENPACNPIFFRQAVGRIDRIGQTRDTFVYFPVYTGTLQETAHKLLMAKVAVSQAVDGIDSTAAQKAAGGGGASLEVFASMSMGRALAEMYAKEQGFLF